MTRELGENSVRCVGAGHLGRAAGSVLTIPL